MLNNILRVLGSNLGVTLIGVFNIFFLPKVLSIDDFSQYQTFILYMSYTAILHLGFPSGMFIKYGGKKFEDINIQEFKTEYNIINLILMFFMLIVMLISIITHSYILGIVAITILPYGVVGSFKSIFQAWGQFKNYSIINFSIPFGMLIFYVAYYSIFKSLTVYEVIGGFVLVYYIFYIYIIISIGKPIKDIKAQKYFSIQNKSLLKNGFVLMLGNYISTLFLSVDKQFVKLFFGNTEFAMYSFAISMQSIMAVFITSIAQPIYPKMARGKLTEDEYKAIQEILFIFGSLSGCAYYISSFVVRNFVPQYFDSIKVIGYYFIVFPVLAVINTLIINLYKVQGKVMRYMKILLIVLLTSVLLNSIVIILGFDYQFIALASTLSYFVWFIIGINDFKFLRPSIRDWLFLLFYIIILFIMTSFVKNVIFGFVLYFSIIILLIFLVYRKRITLYLKLIGVEI